LRLQCSAHWRRRRAVDICDGKIIRQGHKPDGAPAEFSTKFTIWLKNNLRTRRYESIS
jgi:hypothetical protein